MFLSFSNLKGFKDEQKQIFICIPALMTQQVHTLTHKSESRLQVKFICVYLVGSYYCRTNSINRNFSETKSFKTQNDQIKYITQSVCLWHLLSSSSSSKTYFLFSIVLQSINRNFGLITTWKQSEKAAVWLHQLFDFITFISSFPHVTDFLLFTIHFIFPSLLSIFVPSVYPWFPVFLLSREMIILSVPLLICLSTPPAIYLSQTTFLYFLFLLWTFLYLNSSIFLNSFPI